MRFRVGDPVILAIPEDGKGANAAVGATKRMRRYNGERLEIATAVNQQYTLRGYESRQGVPYTVLDEWLIFDWEADKAAKLASDEALYEHMKKYMEG